MLQEKLGLSLRLFPQDISSTEISTLSMIYWEYCCQLKHNHQVQKTKKNNNNQIQEHTMTAEGLLEQNDNQIFLNPNPKLTLTALFSTFSSLSPHFTSNSEHRVRKFFLNQSLTNTKTTSKSTSYGLDLEHENG